MVDSSEQLQEIQRKRLSSASTKAEKTVKHDGTGVTLHWHKALSEVPLAKGAPSIIIGQEFLDCMPVRHFVKTDKGWCEKLVDEAPPDSAAHFRFVLSKGPTPAAKICLRNELIPDLPRKPKNLQGIEVSPEAWWAAQQVAKRVHATGGAGILSLSSAPVPPSVPPSSAPLFCQPSDPLPVLPAEGGASVGSAI